MSENPSTDPSATPPQPHQSFWLWVMCLTGVDYFSTLGYQPSIAFQAAGKLAPLATIILVAVTLLGALPVYAYVAGQSPGGQGSIGMLEKLVHGWGGKILILSLLGFAATDFVITKTLSAADATVHLIENPIWPVGEEQIGRHTQQLGLTFLLLVLLGAMFLRGFREVIGMAVVLVGVYLTLNAIVLGSGLLHLGQHPELFEQWLADVESGPQRWAMQEEAPITGGGWGMVALLCLLLFPKLALGLSGFETGVAVMPLVLGRRGASDAENLQHRIRNTRRLLITAAVIMSVMLLGSSFVVSTLIEPEQLNGVRDPNSEGRMTGKTADGGKPPAKDRALAYLAHGGGERRLNPMFGEVFGTVYDIATVAILWFAGASAMAGLLNLVPQYLPRYGMAPEWARALRPLVVLFTVLNLVVTWVFDADVEKQGGAYATGVLVLMASAGVATVIQRRNAGHGTWTAHYSWGYVFITIVFFYTLIAIVIEKPDGIKIAACFVGAILMSSMISRTLRSTELRFKGFIFKDNESRMLWESMQMLEFPVLVPHRPGRRGLESKEESIRIEHRLGPEVPIVFLEVEKGDTSDFYQQPLMEVIQQDGRFILRITRCASIPHVLAALGLELSRIGKPPEFHFGWSDESPLAANIGFVLFGEGNVPWMVRELIRRAEPNPDRRPRVVVG